MDKKIKTVNCDCLCCRKNWHVVRDWIWELENRIHKIEEATENEVVLVSNDEPDQSSISFRKMEP